MVMLANDSLARESHRPEVWYIDQGLRHWVPDSATVDSLGGWGKVQVLNYPLMTLENPLGEPWPSVLSPTRMYPDGTVITAPPAPEVYRVENDQKRWIPDPETFLAMGLKWEDVHVISNVEAGAIPTGAPYPTKRREFIIVETGDTHLGANHWMNSRVRLQTATGSVSAVTRIWTATLLGGFHGAAYAIFSDQQGFAVQGGQSGLHRWGVDGKWIGRSDRTETWNFQLNPTESAKVANLHVFHTWAADDFKTILDKWVYAGKRVGELMAEGGKIAKVIAAF